VPGTLFAELTVVAAVARPTRSLRASDASFAAIIESNTEAVLAHMVSPWVVSLSLSALK